MYSLSRLPITLLQNKGTVSTFDKGFDKHDDDDDDDDDDATTTTTTTATKSVTEIILQSWKGTRYIHRVLWSILIHSSLTLDTTVLVKVSYKS